MKINKNEFRILGLRRSGNHIITKYIIANCNGDLVYFNNIDPDKNPYYHSLIYFQNNSNKISINGQIGNMYFENKSLYFSIKKERKGFFSKKDYLIYSYEDQEIDDIINGAFERNNEKWVGKSINKYDLLILRDPFNMFASWLKIGILKKDIKQCEHVINLWKEYALEYLNYSDYLKNKVIINYNKFIIDKKYRAKILGMLNLSQTNDSIINDKGGWISSGGGSSFNQKNYSKKNKVDFLKRWKEFENDPFFRNIFKDKELFELSNKIFGKIPGTSILC